MWGNLFRRGLFDVGAVGVVVRTVSDATHAVLWRTDIRIIKPLLQNKT